MTLTLDFDRLQTYAAVPITFVAALALLGLGRLWVKHPDALAGFWSWVGDHVIMTRWFSVVGPAVCAAGWCWWCQYVSDYRAEQWALPPELRDASDGYPGDGKPQSASAILYLVLLVFATLVTLVSSVCVYLGLGDEFEPTQPARPSVADRTAFGRGSL